MLPAAVLPLDRLSLIGVRISGSFAAVAAPKAKKTDVVEHPQVFDHVGLLVNEPPGSAGLPFI